MHFESTFTTIYSLRYVFQRHKHGGCAVLRGDNNVTNINIGSYTVTVKVEGKFPLSLSTVP